MDSDEQQIREVVERWVSAIRAGDLDAVVADHAEDVLMFDVPPPGDGVRGLAAYREVWPPFFAYIRSGAAFDLRSLGVTAGAGVGYAAALLTCGTPDELARRPADFRLRITLGLRREGGRWVIAHEHHSFPDLG